MKCSDLQFNLPLYADSLLSNSETVALDGHLVACPLCRQKYDEYRELHSALRQLRRPEISDYLPNRLKSSVRSEVRLKRRSWIPLSTDIRDYLQMRLMPFGVGFFASLLVGVTFLTIMFSGMLKPAPISVASIGRNTSVMLANNRSPFTSQTASFITPSDFSRSRLQFASESPSVNPQGALIALTKSFIRGGMKDDELVVVAEVFGDGFARISEVVEPSRDSQAVGELERALHSDPSSSPFVPAVMENRPEYMTVVLRFQSVDVRTGSKPAKRRL